MYLDEMVEGSRGNNDNDDDDDEDTIPLEEKEVKDPIVEWRIPRIPVRIDNIRTFAHLEKKLGKRDAKNPLLLVSPYPKFYRPKIVTTGWGKTMLVKK